MRRITAVSLVTAEDWEPRILGHEQGLDELILNMDATPPTTQLPEEGGMCYSLLRKGPHDVWLNEKRIKVEKTVYIMLPYCAASFFYLFIYFCLFLKDVEYEHIF